jgi:hypothetical protein
MGREGGCPAPVIAISSHSRLSAGTQVTFPVEMAPGRTGYPSGERMVGWTGTPVRGEPEPAGAWSFLFQGLCGEELKNVCKLRKGTPEQRPSGHPVHNGQGDQCDECQQEDQEQQLVDLGD